MANEPNDSPSPDEAPGRAEGSAGSAASNPFATRFVRPGELPFEFPPGMEAARLVERLAEQGWQGEIVGPHGSGKSTLVAALTPAIVAAGREPVAVSLHEGERKLPPEAWSLSAGEFKILIVDGYEQLGRWERRRLRRHCAHTGCGLLVTTHASVALPLLFATATSPELAKSLARRLTAGRPEFAIEASDVEASFASRHGNLRETWFALYDLCENRRRRTAADEP